MDPLHQLEDCDSFGDDRKGCRNSSLNYAIDLIVEVNVVVPCGDQEQIRFDQRHIKRPGKIPPQRGLADTLSTIDRDDHSRVPAHDRSKDLHDLRIAGKDGGHGDALRWTAGVDEQLSEYYFRFVKSAKRYHQNSGLLAPLTKYEVRRTDTGVSRSRRCTVD